SQQKPLLLYVWATWCGVCRYTTPSVASLAADGGNVLTVALRSGDNVTLEKWLTRKKLALPTVNDPSGQLARQWDIQVTPTLVVISQGEVKSVTTGWTSSWGMRLRLWLASW
ncbi:TPA: protein disulfide oxidoreductase, partial [Klebsiella pneumoniae]|nr:protein disulfide oxidoreductase [Klebsiella pneumoniae]